MTRRFGSSRQLLQAPTCSRAAITRSVTVGSQPLRWLVSLRAEQPEGDAREHVGCLALGSQTGPEHLIGRPLVRSELPCDLPAWAASTFGPQSRLDHAPARKDIGSEGLRNGIPAVRRPARISRSRSSACAPSGRTTYL